MYYKRLAILVLAASVLGDISVQNKLDEAILFSLEADCDAQLTFLENQVVDAHSTITVPTSLVPEKTQQVCFVLKNEKQPLKIETIHQYKGSSCRVEMFKQDDDIRVNLSPQCHLPKHS